MAEKPQKTPARKPRGFSQGQPGESAFHSPLPAYLRHNELPEVFKKVEGLNDHRLLAMVTALVLEERIDKALAAFMPRYSAIFEETQLNTKINILEALNFIPPHIIDACRIIQKIRNRFAHDLDRTKFSDLDHKVFGPIRVFLERLGFEERKHAPGEDPYVSDFKFAAFIAISSLESYRPNFEMTRKRIESAEFIADLNREVENSFQKHTAGQKAKDPLNIVRNGPMWEWIYEGFSEINDTPPPDGFTPKIGAPRGGLIHVEHTSPPAKPPTPPNS
jgi:hypothetical protein